MNTNLQQALQFATNALSDFARGMNFWSGFELAFGQDYDRAKAELIRQAAIDGTFMVPVRIIDDRSMGIASGAFAAATDTIYLRDSLVRSGDIRSIGSVILEELGHAIDVRVNRIESPGDEGAIFRLLVSGFNVSADLLASLKLEDDWGKIIVDNQELTVEMAVINGTSGNDTLKGSNYTTNTISGYDGDDILIGGVYEDNLYGGDGNDSLSGGEGNDYLYDLFGFNTINGGLGDDIIYAGSENNVDGGSGNDYLTLDYSFKYPAAIIIFDVNGNATGTSNIKGVEHFKFHGSSANDFVNAATFQYSTSLLGGYGNDTLIGSKVNDTLDGGNGIDYLVGGNGNESYIIDDVRDVILELFNEGYDSVYSNVSYSLDNNIEALYLRSNAINGIGNSSSNSISGNDSDNFLDGGADDDFLFGGVGNDTLKGGIGNDMLNGGVGDDILDGSGDSLGLDTFEGGVGNDTYGIYNSATVIIEYAGAGTDTVWTAVNYTLAANVENLYLVGSLTGVGNTSDNILSGYGVGDNTIYGLAGNDILYGGLGNDYLNGGVGNDFLDGGVGNDILDGSGDSAGLDTFVGGAGDDVYGVYKSSTIVVEDAGNVGGNDTVWTAVNYTLAANVENMYLVGALTGNGNASNNFIVGYGADNHIINGLGGDDGLYGGAGSDTLDGGDGIDNLFGGVGNDTFILNKNSADNILDFEFGSDRLQISASAFGGGLVTNTSLLSTQLLIGAGISTANDLAQRLIYNSSNGDLFFDADGNATTSMAIKIGNLGGNNNLGVNSFSII